MQQPQSLLENTIDTSLQLAKKDFLARREHKVSYFQQHQSLPDLIRVGSSPVPATSPLRLPQSQREKGTGRQENMLRNSFKPSLSPFSPTLTSTTPPTTTQPTQPTQPTPPSWIVHQVAQLEAHIRKLRRENQEWTARFRGEARSRSTVLDMQRAMQDLHQDRTNAEQAVEIAHTQVEEAERRERKAVHEAEQWKQLADRKTLSELEQSQIEDMLWKPKYDQVTDLWTVLTKDHDKLRNAFENLFENYLDVT